MKGAIRDVQYSAEGYYGNEASTTTFYASAALVITVPPADERDKTTPPPPLTADRVHVAKVPSKPKPTPAWAKAKAKPTRTVLTKRPLAEDTRVATERPTKRRWTQPAVESDSDMTSSSSSDTTASE